MPNANPAMFLIAALFNWILPDLNQINWASKVNAASTPHMEHDFSISQILETNHPSGPLRLQGGRAIYGTLPAKAKPELRDLNLQVSSRVHIKSRHF